MTSLKRQAIDIVKALLVLVSELAAIATILIGFWFNDWLIVLLGLGAFIAPTIYIITTND